MWDEQEKSGQEPDSSKGFVNSLRKSINFVERLPRGYANSKFEPSLQERKLKVRVKTKKEIEVEPFLSFLVYPLRVSFLPCL